MLCRNPFTRGNQVFGCGQCMPCRFNRRRIWAHRIMLEAALHADNTFVTLTYDDNYLPKDGSVVPEHFQTFLKRLRASIAPVRIRFYGVGEYGDKSGRPHYHAALFGYPNCRYGQSRFTGQSVRCCEQCNRIRDTWGMGNVLLGSLGVDSAQYIAGYVTKKLSNANDPEAAKWLNGRHPEFARMSLRPGIGCYAMDDVADVLMKFNLDVSQGDVPSTLRHGRRALPLGRYLVGKLRERIGKDAKAPQAVLDALEEAVRPLREAARNSSEVPSLKGQVLEFNNQKFLQFSGRQKLKRKERKL